MSFDFIQAQLRARDAQGLLRKRTLINDVDGALIKVDGQHYLNFASNDYLGMRQNMHVLQSWAEGLSVYGAGSGASPLVTGHTQAHQALEDYLADKLERDKVLLFNSGFAANQAICQALMPSQNDHHQANIIADKLIHASLIEGAQASGGRLQRFRHNDLNHAEQLLSKTCGDTLLASESIFSMDGDQAPVTGLADLAEKYQAWLMLDDAHGFGVLGEKGLGVAEAYKLSQTRLPVLMGTFGKAIGTAGAFVAGSADFIDYLVNFARHYVYSTAMPPAQARATLSSVQLVAKGEQRQQLHDNIALFRDLAQQADLPLTESISAIQPIIIGDTHKAMSISDKLKSLGIWVTAMRSPTVPKGTERLRITLTSAHQSADIQALVDALSLALNLTTGHA